MLPIAPDTLLQQRYRILNIIREGEFGRTYLATDRDRADASCAIAEIVPSIKFPSTVAKANAFFKEESTRLYQLQHLQIPRFWTTFEEQDRLFLVRDYIAGKTYKQLLEERRDLGRVFNEAEVWQFLRHILPAIGYIHSKGIIHRDISPEHIICRESDGLPVLIDLAAIEKFARKLQANPIEQQSSVEKPGYAPLEQLNSGQVYPNSDLYALAVTAIVLLTGKEPSALFSGDLINWDWRKWTPISDEFAKILGRMSSLHPNDRYQSATEVDRDLQSLDIPNNQPNASHPSTVPTVAVGSSNTPSEPNPVQTAITNLNSKSFWEKPQVYIPLGLLISLLAGFGSWFGVSQLRHSKSAAPVASTPPKQIDFNNPTIPTDSDNPSPTASDIIQPEMDLPIVKEGTIDPSTPVRFRIPALAGQNLDIQLVQGIAENEIDPLKPNPSQTKDPKFNNPPISLPSPITATQVLMTILSPAGTPIDDGAARVVSWRGEITTSGDYTIELRPIKGLAGSSFPYKLSVTQVAVTPSELPAESDLPSPGSTPPLTIPIPSGNGINAIPTDPKTNLPSNDSNPSIAPTPNSIVAPKPAPIESERPTRRRRRNRTESNPSPQVRERNRVESTEETPTPRRRRNRVESSEETPTPRRRRNRVESSEETPTPRRRRNRQTNSETQSQPSPSPKADVNDNEPSSKPESEPQISIPVPPAKSILPEPNKTDGNSTPPSNSDANDSD
jgi:serine/threonine protein kinase